MRPHALQHTSSSNHQISRTAVRQNGGDIEITWSDLRIPKNARQSYTIATADVGQCVGDEGLLETGYTTSKHLFGAYAQTPASLYYIKRDDLDALFYQYPAVKASCHKAVALKVERWLREAERIVRESASQGGAAETSQPLAHTYEPRGTLPLPVFSSTIARVSMRSFVRDFQQQEETGSNVDSDITEPTDSEPSNRELAAKVDALDEKLNKIVDMMRHAKLERKN